MTVTILTLFPDVFTPIFSASILKRAQEKDLVYLRTINIRDFATDTHKTVDDKPYGGGIGMILRIDVLARAITAVKKQLISEFQADPSNIRTLLMDPKGTPFTQEKAQQLTSYMHLIFVSGHYEGVDARITNYVDESLSLGQFILTGGEIPAMAMTDAVVRLLPGVITEGALEDETFAQGLIEYPHYTRPSEFQGAKVPDILLSGNHKQIKEWRSSQKKKTV